MKATRVHAWSVCCCVLLLAMVCFPETAIADRTITSVELDESASGILSVAPAADIAAEIFVTTTWWWGGNNDWGSTSWRIGDGPSVCVDHEPDHTSSGDYSEIFNLTAPVTAGTYSVNFVAYNNDQCSGGSGSSSNTYTRQIEVTPVFPSVAAISRASLDPTTANATVAWTIEFSEAVTGVEQTDFALAEAGGTTGSVLTSVSGSGSTWTVMADTGTAAAGTLGLNLVDDDTVVNGAGLPLGGPGAGNGDYAGPVYTLVPPAPVLDKTASTSAATVGDVVTFSITVSNPYSDPLSGVSVTDSLPAGMSYVTHVAADGSVDVTGETLTWTIDSLPGQGSVQLILAVSLIQQGTYINTVTSPGADPASATVLALASAVTHFRMDEPVASWSGASGEVIDSGGTALHGRRRASSLPTGTNVVDPDPTIASQHESVVGGFCNAGDFDGSAVVQVADSPLFDYTTELSASAWVYPTAYPSDLASILSNDVNYEFHLDSSGRLYWWWQADTLTSDSQIPLNQWTHIAITLDSAAGSPRQRIYINGELDTNTNNWRGTLNTNNCNFHIGGDVDTGNCQIIDSRNFQGMIDEVKLYGFELSQAEVRADMRLGRSCSGGFDHLRIEHDGIASVCAPETVTIKACLNADCTALYPGNVTVNLAPSGWIGGDTVSFSGGIAAFQLSHGTPGDVTLGTNSISPTPAGATRCFDGGTETCILNFADVSCDFDAVEPGQPPQTPIFTKLSGVSFAIDVLALLDPLTLNPDYVNTVAVDLVDASSSACPSGSGLTPATDLAFSQTDAGRKAVTFNYSHAAANVKVRARVGASAPSCSSDNFAIRPQGFSVTSGDATNIGTSGLPVLVAGAPFRLSAETLSGYDGTPEVDETLVSGSPIAGTLSGSFNAASPATGTATGTDFRYSEVGHFGMAQHAVYDDSFTAVDQPDQCRAGFSNILSDGRYGCSFGSAAIPLVTGSSGFGRFIPARFAVTGNASAFANACSSSFTYLGQAFPFLVDPVWTLTALNQSGTVTRNYGGDYWKLASTLQERSYINNVTTASGLSVSTTGSVSWNDTADADGVGTVVLEGEQLTYSKPANPEGPFTADIDLVLSANDLTDSDGVCYDPENDGSCNSYRMASIPGGEFRYGRMQLQNAFGPETRPLAIPLRTEYFNGQGFILNTADDCTEYRLPHLLLDDGPADALDASEVTPSDSDSLDDSLSGGLGSDFLLSAPVSGDSGSIGLLYDLDAAGLSWLKPGGSNPTGKATFGIFKSNQHLIYMRESLW